MSATVYPTDSQSDKFLEGKYAEWVKRELGYPVVGVELTDPQIKDAVEDMLLLYTKFKPRKLTESWMAPQGISKHEWVTPGVRGVSPDIQMTGVQEGLLAPNIEAQMLSGAFAYYGVRAPLYDIRYYEYLRQWAKIAARELSSEPDYHLEDDPKNGVWIYGPGTSVKCFATVIVDHLSTETILPADQSWARRYVLAKCKTILGGIRKKFSEIPGANKSIALDGIAMAAEGAADMKELQAELEESRTFLVPSWG